MKDYIIAWKIGDKVNYALEGSVFVAGRDVGPSGREARLPLPGR